MRHLVCTDLHGRYDLWERIAADLQPDDKLFFLGDAIDRGPDGIKILQSMANDSRVTFFMGNHEDMMYKAICSDAIDIVTIDNYEYSRDDVRYLWMRNGGYDTLEAFKALNIIDQNKICDYLYASINEAEYTRPDGKKFILSHAGFTPGSRLVTPDEQLWDRTHFAHPWPSNQEDVVIVHGHTPIPHVIMALENFGLEAPADWDEASPLIYRGGHKICLDCMSFFTSSTVVYNLDDDTYQSYTI